MLAALKARPSAVRYASDGPLVHQQRSSLYVERIHAVSGCVRKQLDLNATACLAKTSPRADLRADRDAATCAQYMNVVLGAEMSLVDKPHLKAVVEATPAPEGTPSDLLDGLMVAQELLSKTLPPDEKPDKHDRRIILARTWLRHSHGQQA